MQVLVKSGQQQLHCIDNMPDCQPQRQQCKRYVKFSPVADHIATKLFALHRSLYTLQLSHLFLCAWHERTGTSELALLVWNETVLTSFSTHFLRRRFKRDIGKIPGCIERLLFICKREAIRYWNRGRAGQWDQRGGGF